MWFFDLNEPEYLTFFAVMVRFTVLFAMVPIIGDKMVPSQVKVFLGLTVSILLYPILVKNGQIDPLEALQWGSTTWGIVSIVVKEAAFGLILGFVTKMIFDAIYIGAEISGTFMGFAAATQFDPQAQTQTGLITKFQVALGMLIFLTVNGHHIMMRAILESYRIVGLGSLSITEMFTAEFIGLTSGMIKTGFQLAAPMGVSFFAVNIVYGIMAKALPQLNILVLSFSVSALVGFFVLMMGVPAFYEVSNSIFDNLGENMGRVMMTLSE